MGAIAEAIVAYAQPLIDQSDGSIDQMNRAMTLAQMCWNFAILPDDVRDTAIEEMKPALNMTDDEFADFRNQVIFPMIRRHRAMFSGLHERSKRTSNIADAESSPTKKCQGTDRYAPCSCGSGRKYKFCCGAR